MKRLIAMAIVALTAIEFVSAAPTVTDITAKQRYPWNGLVDIGCKVSGIEGTINGYTFVVVAVDKDSGKEYTATHCTAKHDGSNLPDGSVAENGDYELLWDARTDMGQVVVERMTVRVTLEAAGVAAGMVQLWEGGPYWADRNIGASKPEDCGLYFWWGDTTGHRPSAGGTFGFSFNSSNCPTYGKSASELRSEGWITSAGVLAPAHDAAHVHWGGAWRMPTSDEIHALDNNCTTTWTTRNGVYGRLVTGKGAYANRSIFLPAAGVGDASALIYLGSVGDCWSSSPNSGYSHSAWSLYFLDSSSFGFGRTSGSSRYGGRSVRPVRGFAE